MPFCRLIKGNTFSDDRGNLTFFNSLKMQAIVRMYEIRPKETEVWRGWQAHKLEHKWFRCTVGSFDLRVVAVDNFNNPSKDALPQSFFLSEKEPSVLHITGGYATCFKALVQESVLSVYSNVELAASKNDDFRFEVDYWKIK